MKKKEYMTPIWQLYERGQLFKTQRNIFNLVDETHRFYNGNQWEGLNSGAISPISINVIKPIVKSKLGVVNSNDYEIILSPNNIESPEFNKELEVVTNHLNRYIAKQFEVAGTYKNIKKMIKDACITGEGVLYFDYDLENKETYTRVIPMSNISYGNENDPVIEDQPYIIISMRRPVDAIKAEAKLAGKTDLEIESIRGELVDNEQAGDASVLEVNDMVTVVYKLYKEDGVVKCDKSTKGLIYRKALDTGLTLYPVVHINWEDVEGNARGVGAVQYNIANQKEINKTAMRRALTILTTSYPKIIYNEGKITDDSVLTEVGVPIAVSGNGVGVTDIRQNIGYLNAATTNNDAGNFQQELMTETRNSEGAGDYVTGDINPEQASGKAILAVQQAAQQPLKEQIDKVKSLYKEIGAIKVDFYKAYGKKGKTISIEEEATNPQTGATELREVPYKIKGRILSKMKLNFKVDITPKTPFDKMAQELSLENLLAQKLITFEEYVDALDETSNMPVKKLELIIKEREIKKQQMLQQKQAMDEMFNKLGQGINQQQRQVEVMGGPSPEELAASQMQQ